DDHGWGVGDEVVADEPGGSAEAAFAACISRRAGGVAFGTRGGAGAWAGAAGAAVHLHGGGVPAGDQGGAAGVFRRSESRGAGGGGQGEGGGVRGGGAAQAGSAGGVCGLDG